MAKAKAETTTSSELRPPPLNGATAVFISPLAKLLSQLPPNLKELQRDAAVRIERLIDFLNLTNGWDEREEEPDGDELDELEACDLEISGEADGLTGGCVDDEPSLGSLDDRVSQLRWSAPDRPVLDPNRDLELDEAEHEIGIEDEPHDEELTA